MVGSESARLPWACSRGCAPRRRREPDVSQLQPVVVSDGGRRGCQAEREERSGERGSRGITREHPAAGVRPPKRGGEPDEEEPCRGVPRAGNGFGIPRIELEVAGGAEGVSGSRFFELAEQAKASCAVSKALVGTEIT